MLSKPALAIIVSALLLTCPATMAAERFIALSYHDVQDRPETERTADAITIATADLVAHFAWLREHGYQPVSVDDIVAARDGRRPLPDKAVLLTFDDGYTSVYTRVFPLLKLFDFPAVVALQVGWIEQPAGARVDYGGNPVARDRFLTWTALKEMADSGLVEIASHSLDLHRGVQGNPQGNRQPAAVTLRYDAETETYESEDDYRERVGRDLAESARIIEVRTGRRPRVMVWPYGRYNQILLEEARAAGMPVTLSLNSDGSNNVDELAVFKRALVGDHATLPDLVDVVSPPKRPAPPMRAAHVDLDYVYDPDPAQQKRNLDRLLDRIKALRISTVYLQAFADPDGDGNASAVYFPNRHLPVRADLFNRVAWQLKTRSEVEVYAWMPTLAFQPAKEDPLRGRLVQRQESGGTTADAGAPGYRRLSPFSPAVRHWIGELYEDLARHAHFDGILFHDDAYLTDFEDASAVALATYRQWGFSVPIPELRESPVLMREWTHRKTQALIAWTDTLTERVRRYRPEVKTARNLYAEVVMNPEAEAWYAQSLDAFLEHYDHAALMAMPYMEGAADPKRWLHRLVSRVAAHPAGLSRTVFELQSVDWRNAAPIDTASLRRQMRLLLRSGALNFGYYPEDFIAGHPDIDAIKPALSLSTYPYPE